MRFALVGPVHPYRGGIAHHTALLASALASRHEVSVHSFRRQYPGWLYPGESDRDNSRRPLAVDATYSLDPLYPWTWSATAGEVARARPDLAVIQWWVPFWGPALGSVARLLSRSEVPAVFICHNVLPHEPQPWQRRLVRWTLSAGRALVLHSQEQSATSSALGLTCPTTVRPLPTYSSLAGDLPAPEDARRALGIAEGKVLLYFGLVRPYKGLEYLLRALPLAFPAGDARLAVAGEFWEPLSRYQTLADKLGIGDRVTWGAATAPTRTGTARAAAEPWAPDVEATRAPCQWPRRRKPVSAPPSAACRRPSPTGAPAFWCPRATPRRWPPH